MRFGLICSPVPGHLRPNLSLAAALVKRGHQVTAYQIADARSTVERAGVGFSLIGERLFPAGTWGARWAVSREHFSLRGHLSVAALHRDLVDVFCDEMTTLARRDGCDAVLCDQMQVQGAVIAEALGVPLVSTCVTMPMQRGRSWDYPPPIAAWDTATNAFERARNAAGWAGIEAVMAPFVERAMYWSKRLSVSKRWSLASSRSRVCTVCAVPREFDLESAQFDETFHWCGPFLAPREADALDDAMFDGRPLVYASAGTLRNLDRAFYERVAEACAPLGVQLVIGLGAWQGDALSLGKLPGDPLLLGHAPQRALLDRASVMITHGGINSILEALEVGVPMLCMPITDEQPSNSLRVARRQVGLVVERTAPSDHVRAAMRRLLEDAPNGPRAHARAFAQQRAACDRARGMDPVSYAASVIERAIAAG